MSAVAGWSMRVLAVALMLPYVSAAQRVGEPMSDRGQDRGFGRIMVITPSDSLGDTVSEAVRRRLNSDPGTRDLEVVSLEDVTAVAAAAHPRPATPQSSSRSRSGTMLTFPDARSLARFVRADMLVSITSRPSAGGVTIDALVASVTDDEPRSLVAGAVGSVDSVSALVMSALREDSAYRQLRTRQRN
jgi:hypothetical protein